MSPSNWTDVATSRLIPASGGMVKNVAVPRKRPGIVIFLHGVNDPGASYKPVEAGLCQGLNERLDRTDLRPGEYGARYAAAKGKPRVQLNDREFKIIDDPDTHLYQRDDTHANSMLIPFYWGYRAAEHEIQRDPNGDPSTLRTQYQDKLGNRLDRHFGKPGGFFANATNNLPEMYGKGFDSAMRHAVQVVAPNTQYFGLGPHRRYFVLAAERLATMISTIRSKFPSETITVIGHSQGTLVTLLSQAMLVERGARCADCVVMVDTPYSVETTTTPAGSDTLGTLLAIVNQITATPYPQPSLEDMCSGGKQHFGRTGKAWTGAQGQRLGKDGKLLVFPERDNRGKVLLYFCPDDTTVSLDKVVGIGTYGVPDQVTDRVKTQPAMDTLRDMRFYQRMWTKRYRVSKPVMVGDPPRSHFLRAADEPRYPGASWMVGLLALEPVAEGTWRLINGEALTPPHVPQMFGGEAVKGSPTQVGKDRPDDVSQAVALGNPKANFKWIEMERRADVANTEQVRARFNQGKEPDDQTQTVRNEIRTRGRDGMEVRVLREETPNEIRKRMTHDTDTLEPNSYHSAVLRDPENHRWVTAMDIAIGQAHTLDDPQWRQLLTLMGDWRMTKEAHAKIKTNAIWNTLDERSRSLVKATHIYYESGKFPGNDLVRLDSMPPLVRGRIPQ